MDIDQVQRGNGGKDQKPHDHNRDWTDAPLYASVRTSQIILRELVTTNRLSLFLDLHDPGWGGPFEWWIGSLAQLPPETRSRVEGLAELFRVHCTKSYSFKGFKETGTNYGGGRTARAWVGRISRETTASGTLEIPVAPPTKFTQAPPAQHLILGAEMGKSLLHWLETPVPSTQENQNR